MSRSGKISALILTFCILTSFFASGCAEEHVDISFSWWGQPNREEYTLKGIESYEREYDYVTVNPVNGSWANYSDGYKAKMEAGLEEDVMQINYDWLLKYSADGNGYYDLSKLEDVLNLNGYKSAELKLGTMNGKLNAIPVGLNSNIFYYNKTVFEKYGIMSVPRTWDDIFEAARIMNGEAYPLMMSQKSIMFAAVAYTEQQTGKSFINSYGRLAFSKNEVKMLINMAAYFVEKKITPPVSQFSSDLVTSGKAAGFFTWVTDADNMAKGARELGNVIVTGDYPGAYIYNRSGYYIKPSVLYAISVNTENPKESGRFLNYLINDDYFATLQGNDKGFPINDYVFRNIDKDAASFSYDAYLRMESDEERMQLEHPGMEDPDAVLAFERAYNAVLKGVDPDIEAAALYNELRTIWK